MYLITGATGNVGSGLVEQLLAAGERVRVYTRDANKVERWNGRVEVAVGDFSEPERFADAVAGVDGVFLMNGGLDGAVFERLVETIKAAGEGKNGTPRAPRVVFLSSILAGNSELLIGRMHREKEEAIRRAGLAGRFVRPGGFMSNVLGWAKTIKAEGTVFHPLADGRAAVIAPDDIAGGRGEGPDRTRQPR